MSKALAVQEESQSLALSNGVSFSKEEIDLIKADICKGSSDAELRMFLAKCKRTRLDPFLKQIYSIKRYVSGEGGGPGGYVHQTQVSIDGARLVAERSGKYEGQVGPFYCGSDGNWREVWLEDAPPAAAKVGVLKSGFQAPIFATARYSSYVQTKKDKSPNAMWEKMPDTMLAKCAEMLALRKAFPADLGGLYTAEEMGQVENGVEPVQYEADPEKAQIMVDLERLARRVFKDPAEWSNFLGSRELAAMTVEAIKMLGKELREFGEKNGSIPKAKPKEEPVVVQAEVVEESPAPAAAQAQPEKTHKKPTAAMKKLFWATVGEKLTIGGQFIGDEVFYWWLQEKSLAPFDDNKNRVSVNMMTADDMNLAIELISHAKPSDIVHNYQKWVEEGQ